MKKCEECGKDLRLLKGYQHPTLGKKYIVCSPCFDQVSASVAKWREFVILNSFNNDSYSKTTKLEWKKIIPSFTKVRKVVDTEWTKKEINIKR